MRDQTQQSLAHSFRHSIRVSAQPRLISDAQSPRRAGLGHADEAVAQRTQLVQLMTRGDDVFRMVEKRKEAIAEFKKAGRDDLAEKEAAELVFIEGYLPKQMTEAEVAAHIKAKVAALGTVSQKDFGRVMGEILK